MKALKDISSVLLLLWVWLAPVHAALGAVLALPAIDLLMALIVQYKKLPIKGLIPALQMIRSSGLKRTVGKICMYEIATMLAFVVETSLTGPVVPVIKLVTGLIGITELKSCLEHLDELNGSPLFASLLDKLSPNSLKGPDDQA